MSIEHTPINSSNQYYLQSLGIDLYQLRGENDNAPTESPVKSNPIADLKRKLKSKPAEQAKSVFVVSLADINKSRLVADICLWLDITTDSITRAGDAAFRLGELQWHFTEQGSKVSFSDNKLVTGTLDTLNNAKTKAELFQFLHILTIKP